MGTLTRQRDRLQVGRRLDSLMATDKGLWGVMTVAEMLRHVRLAFQMALGEMPVRPAPPGGPGGLMKLLALRAPLRWPQGVRTVPELEQRALPTETSGFAQEHAALRQAMSRFLDGRQIRTGHPMFGPMSTGDWMRWGYRHTDHHLRQFGR